MLVYILFLSFFRMCENIIMVILRDIGVNLTLHVLNGDEHVCNNILSFLRNYIEYDSFPSFPMNYIEDDSIPSFKKIKSHFEHIFPTFPKIYIEYDNPNPRI